MVQFGLKSCCLLPLSLRTRSMYFPKVAKLFGTLFLTRFFWASLTGDLNKSTHLKKGFRYFNNLQISIKIEISSFSDSFTLKGFSYLLKQLLDFSNQGNSYKQEMNWSSLKMSWGEKRSGQLYRLVLWLSNSEIVFKTILLVHKNTKNMRFNKIELISENLQSKITAWNRYWNALSRIAAMSLELTVHHHQGWILWWN